MEDLRSEKMEVLFEKARALPPEQRAAFLDEACGADEALRAELVSLLAFSDEAPGFLNHLAEGVIVPTLAALLDEPNAETTTPPPQSIGQTISHYRIVEKLGGGGMGVVYKAHDTRLDRAVALKFLPPHLSLDEEAKARFIHEAKAASALDHANICTIHDIGETEQGQLFIVMAYYAGETLKKKIARGPLPVDEALAYARQVAQGLAKAHEESIVHRDVKSANMMITEDNVAKIVDFGLAKMADVSLTQTGTTLGTVAYMSPEQALGQAVDHRTDLWSLGVVLYEMLTGERPFKGDYADAVIYAIRHDAPQPLTALRPEASEALERVVEKALAKNPDERYQHAGEMLADLGAPQRIREEARLASPSTPSSRRRRALLYGGVAALVLVLALIGYALSIGGPPIASIAVLPLDNLSGDSEQEIFADGMTEELITTLNKIEALRAIGRRSVMRFKGSDEPITDIAQMLNVQHVVDGSVLREGNQVRITINLFEATSDVALWGHSFEREMRDVLALQSEVALAVARAIEVQMTPQEQARLEETRTVDPKAYVYFVLGRHYRWKEDFQEAIKYLKLAIAEDSTYAPAWAALAYPYFTDFIRGSLPYSEALSRVRMVVEKALALDSTLAEAHVANGVLHQTSFDWPGAEPALRRAVRLNPESWEARYELGALLVRTRRFEEGLAEMKHLPVLEPLDPQSYHGVAYAYYYSRQFEQAISQYEAALQIDSTSTNVLHGLAYLWLNRFEEAIALLKATDPRASVGSAPAILGIAYAVSGRREEALGILDKLEAQRDTGPAWTLYAMTAIYTRLGEVETALDLLELKYERDGSTPFFIGVDPTLDPLRSEPRFQAVLQKLGLNEQPR